MCDHMKETTQSPVDHLTFDGYGNIISCPESQDDKSQNQEKRLSNHVLKSLKRSSAQNSRLLQPGEVISRKPFAVEQNWLQICSLFLESDNKTALCFSSRI